LVIFHFYGGWWWLGLKQLVTALSLGLDQQQGNGQEARNQGQGHSLSGRAGTTTERFR